MPAERLGYADDTFDIIIARDILHHVDIAANMREVVRVGKSDAMFVADEIYSRSVTDNVRHSRLVEQFLYPRMQRLIYDAGKPYITSDEHKLSGRDIATITAFLRHPELKQYFNFITTRLVPDPSDFFAKLDRVLLGALKPFGSVLAGEYCWRRALQRTTRMQPICTRGTPDVSGVADDPSVNRRRRTPARSTRRPPASPQPSRSPIGQSVTF